MNLSTELFQNRLMTKTLELAGASSWYAAPDKKAICELSSEAFEILGLTPSPGHQYCDLLVELAPHVVETDRESFFNAIEQLWNDLKPTNAIWDLRFRILRPVDTTLVHVRMAAQLIISPEDGRAQIIGVMQNLTAQSRIERDLRETQQKFELAVLGTGDGLWVYEYNDDKTWFSPRFMELLGFENDAMLPSFDAWRDRFHPEDSPRVLRAFNEHVRDNKDFDCEYRVQHNAGHYVWFRARAQSLRNGRGQPYITAGNVSDLTPLKQAQEKVINSEKMASLGGLVAGVAHEMNTPMGVALTTTSQLEVERNELAQHYKSKSMTREMLEQFLDHSESGIAITLANLTRAAELVRSFKQVAADQASEAPRTINLGDYVEDTLRNLQPIIRSARISIDLKIAPNLVIDVISGALSQVLTNLVQNAALHAFQNVESPMITITATRQDAKLVMIFADNGRGMSSEVQQKAFDPFFTTKRDSGGTGLGLHIVHNLVAGPLAGEVKLNSRPDRGCEFIITIPV